LSQKNADGTTNYFYFINTNDIVGSATAAGSGALAKTVFTPVGSSPTSITTTYSYQYWDGAKQTAIMKQASNESVAHWAPGTSSMSYDVNGFLTSARDNTGGRQFTYFNNASGQVLRRDERNEYSPSTATDDVTFVHYWYYANGRRVGEVTTDPNDNQRISYAESLAISLASPKKEAEANKRIKPVTSADFDQNYEPIGPNYPASTPSTYIARSGDTLRSVAQALWGDGDMWYLLAQTNNLQGDEQLVAGQVLIVPNKVTNIHNNANTFRPYNPGEVIGHIDPTLPQPPQQNNSSGCGGLGIVLMIVVAIAVTVVTAGAAAAAFGVVVPGASGVVATGLGVMGGVGGFSALGVASAAIGAAVGSAASQVVGMAAGVVDDFSWKAVAQSALSAGVTAGVGGALHTAGILSSASTAANVGSNGVSVTGSTAQAASSGGSWIATAGKAALSGGLSAAATQAIQGKWSWRDIAANAVGSAAGSVAGSAVGDALKNYEVGAFASRMASSFAGAAAADQVRATDPNYTRASTSSMFVSSLGNALGSSVVDAMTLKGVSAYDYRNGADIDSDNAPAAREWRESYYGRNGADVADDAAGEQAAFDRLVEAGASEQTAGKYAAVFRDLAADPTRALDFGRGSASALEQQFASRPADAEQASVYDKVLGLKDKTAADAWFAAKDVAYRQRIDDLGVSVDDLKTLDPQRAAALQQEHRLGVMALLNREVYFDEGMPELLPRGWSRLSDAAGLVAANLTPEMLVDKDSGYFAALYRNEIDNTYVYANRGTDGGSEGMKDWTHNFLQAVGAESSQYTRALDNAREVASSALAGAVTFTGHSLGGGLASAQAFATGIAGVTFNAAGLSPSTVGSIGAAQMTGNQGLVKAYYVKGELLSTLQDDGRLAGAALMTALGSPVAGLATYAALSNVPAAAGTRIAMDAVSNPSYGGGTWQPGSPFTALTPSTALDLHGMSYVLNSVMQRISRGSR
jgi:LysM repeat protein